MDSVHRNQTLTSPTNGQGSHPDSHVYNMIQCDGSLIVSSPMEVPVDSSDEHYRYPPYSIPSYSSSGRGRGGVLNHVAHRIQKPPPPRAAGEASAVARRNGAVISKKRSTRALALPQRQNCPGQQVSRNDNAPTSDDGTGDTTYAFPAHLLGEFDAPAADGVEPRVSAVEGPPNRPARLLVMRGPNAGSQFLLHQPVTSAGRHPNSDIFLDDITVSRRHAEFRLENGQFRLVDLDSLNSTYLNHEPIESAVLVDGDEIQISKFRLLFLTRPTTG
jgi:pSer/pThr/pTyr-binding forkhead associated (FHA) protein